MSTHGGDSFPGLNTLFGRVHRVSRSLVPSFRWFRSFVPSFRSFVPSFRSFVPYLQIHHRSVGPVRLHWNPFLFAHPSLLATAVYSKNRVVPFWADPFSHWFMLIFALPRCVPRWWSYQRQWAIKHSHT